MVPAPFTRWPPHVAWLRPLPGAGLSGPNGFTSPNLNPNPTRLSGPWGHRVGREEALCCLPRELFSSARALSSASCQLSVTPWGRGQREPAGWWPGDLMRPLRQSQAGSREATRQRQAWSTGTRVRGGSELVWKAMVPQEARKRVDLQAELSDAFQQLLMTELPNPQGLSGVSGGPGTSLGSSRSFLQRSCS